MRLRLFIIALAIFGPAHMHAQTPVTCTPTPKTPCICVYTSATACVMQPIDTLKGPPGQAATIAIGSVIALPAGTKPTVNNSGTPQNVVLNFGLTTGNQGATGQIPGLTAIGKTLTWGDGTSGWSWVINSGGTMYTCTPTSNSFACAVVK